MDLLDDYVGKVETDIKVETTIDPRIQDSAELALVDTLGRNGARYDVKQGACGGHGPRRRGESAGRRPAAITPKASSTARSRPKRQRAPRSNLLSIYRAGSGHDASTLREDGPIQLKGWKPENFTRDYKGMVTLSSALPCR